MPERIHLLDFTEDGRRCAELQSMLAPTFELSVPRAETPLTPSCLGQLAARASALRPALIFILLSGALLRHTVQVFGSVRRGARPLRRGGGGGRAV
jgi:hypothetical protein